MRYLAIVGLVALLAGPALAAAPANVDIKATIALYAEYNITQAVITVIPAPKTAGTETFAAQVVGTSQSNGTVQVTTSTGKDLSLGGLDVTKLTTEIQTVVTGAGLPPGGVPGDWLPSNQTYGPLPLPMAPGVVYTTAIGVRLLNRQGLADPAGAYSGKTLTLTLVTP